jgi:hypothetical protein
VKERKDKLAKFRRLPVCAEMKSTWRLTTGDEEVSENEPNAQEPGANKNERKKRKRKLMKGLKKYTGTLGTKVPLIALQCGTF